jgi:nucleotide-binding universal stress UspA family protein
MPGSPSRILIPTDLTPSSNSIFPLATTVAQAFGSKLYLLHVMDPEWANQPERLEDFPHMADLFGLGSGASDLPPLKPIVPVAKMYIYNPEPPRVILEVAKMKQADLICMACTKEGFSLAWWSAGETVEEVVKRAPCSVLCMRGKPEKEKDWKRPHLNHILLMAELTPRGLTPIEKVMPWVQKFNGVLHIFPLLKGKPGRKGEQAAIRDLLHIDNVRTNVLLFTEPGNRKKNLMSIIHETPIDLIVMTPRVRGEFSNPLLSDIFVQLLRVTDVPILFLR